MAPPRTTDRFGPFSIRQIRRGLGYRVYRSGKLLDTGSENYSPTWFSWLEGKDKPYFVEDYKVFRTREDARDGLQKYLFTNKSKLSKEIGDKRFISVIDNIIK